jgi:DNA-binding LytR/AlgR family response regulator
LAIAAAGARKRLSREGGTYREKYDAQDFGRHIKKSCSFRIGLSKHVGRLPTESAYEIGKIDSVCVSPGGSQVRIAVCDDEEIHQNIILALLKKWAANANIEIDIAAFDNAEELLMLWEDVVFDILVLDIEMKKLSGMEFAKAIRCIDEDVIIIFVTSHVSYSLEGYDVNPLHFLMKPLDEKKFCSVLDKANIIYKLKGKNSFVLHTESGLIKMSVNKILYISMYSHNAEIYTDDETYVARMTINELLQSLPTHFINCHRSYIINMLKVVCVFDDHAVISGDITIPISRGRLKKVRECFMRLRTR